MRIHVAITADGQIRFLTTPELQGLTELGQTSTRRASHVVPQNRLLRLALPSASSGTASQWGPGLLSTPTYWRHCWSVGNQRTWPVTSFMTLYKSSCPLAVSLAMVKVPCRSSMILISVKWAGIGRLAVQSAQCRLLLD